MRVSHFAQIQAVVPSMDNPLVGELRTVGMAQSINVDDDFGTSAERTIGTPFPVLAPGYQVTNIRIEKATIDGSDFRNLGAFNPLWAHIGEIYQDANRTRITPLRSILNIEDDELLRFMFVLAIRNRVSQSFTHSNINRDNTPALSDSGNRRSSSFGIYACVLRNASISMTSQQQVIMDSVTAVARPVSGTWLNDMIRDAFATNSDSQNGMLDVVHGLLYGYRS